MSTYGNQTNATHLDTNDSRMQKTASFLSTHPVNTRDLKIDPKPKRPGQLLSQKDMVQALPLIPILSSPPPHKNSKSQNDVKAKPQSLTKTRSNTQTPPPLPFSFLSAECGGSCPPYPPSPCLLLLLLLLFALLRVHHGQRLQRLQPG